MIWMFVELFIKWTNLNHLCFVLKTQKKVNELLVYDFLKHLQQIKTDEINKLQYELQMINEDCKLVEDSLNTLKVVSFHLFIVEFKFRKLMKFQLL